MTRPNGTLRELGMRLLLSPAGFSIISATGALRLYRSVAVPIWRTRGCPLPPPNAVKHAIVRHYATLSGHQVFVETGTYLGLMVDVCRREFRQIHSVELSRELFERARGLFQRDRHVNLIHGDSAQVLRSLLPTIQEGCVFWLDAHYCRGPSARGNRDTPILEELDAILQHSLRTHVVLIDDARCFGSFPGYPSLEEIRQLIAQRRPEWEVQVRDDVIRAHAPYGRR